MNSTAYSRIEQSNYFSAIAPFYSMPTLKRGMKIRKKSIKTTI